MPVLDGPMRLAQSGRTTSVVVLLHGYGADGHDLIGLADAWRAALPDTLFLAPDAPERISGYLGGRQWFPLDRRDAGELRGGVLAARPLVDRYLDGVLDETGVEPDRLALFGFSQGAMMALHVGLRRAAAPAAILAYSGRLAAPELLTAEIACRPPVLLVHGMEDGIISVDALAEARESLRRAGVPVTGHTIADLGHGIDETGLDLGARMLEQALAP
ncbi:MAG: dienelactone hydrolase family protein [Hyphomicrobiaceae bacterium]